MNRVVLKSIAAICCLSLSAVACSATEIESDAPAKQQILRGKYWGFNRETYAMDEAGIEKFGCSITISRADFYDNIANSPAVIAKFRKDNIRAKVIGDDDISYYIDMSGVLEFNGQLIQIDRKKFENDISKVGQKHC